MKKPYIFLVFIFIIQYAYPQENISLKLLQLNVWLQGSQIENGIEAISDVIIESNADIVTLSETGNPMNYDFIGELIASLKQKNVLFYGNPSIDSGIISKFTIVNQEVVFPLDDSDHGTITKATIDFSGTRIYLYSFHLDYQHYAAYLPRGYDGQTWKKIDHPIINSEEVLAFNSASFREKQIKVFLNECTQEMKSGGIVMIGGDFNEPSHLDWTFHTKDLYDHHGAIIPWPCTLALQNAGFTDSYRELYPNPVSNPGFTFPSNNPKLPVKKLAWAPDADERDRIDYIFYHKNENVRLENISILGPSSSIVRNKRVTEITQDPFFSPISPWPTDHKALLATFSIKTGN